MVFCECVELFVFACVWLCVVCLCICGYEFDFVLVYAFESIICGYVAVFLSIFLCILSSSEFRHLNYISHNPFWTRFFSLSFN